MKLKRTTLEVYPEYEGSGFFVEGAKDLHAAIEAVNEEDFTREWKSCHAKFTTLHRCLDCDSNWTHDGDYVCGECGAHRLSKKYIEAWYFSKNHNINHYKF